jgi:hypothetical protein
MKRKMAATEDFLGQLHNATAKALMDKLNGIKILDEEGNPTGEVIPPSAADIQAAAKFLKDNNITCAPSEDNKLGELEEKLKEKQARRLGRITPGDLAEANAQANFLTGLPN